MVSKLGRFNLSSEYANANPEHEDLAAQNQAERELDRLNAELDQIKKTLAERESALAQAALDAQQARERWQQQLAARVAAAEAQSRREKSVNALAELTARCEAAEQTVEPLEQEQAEQGRFAVDSTALAPLVDGDTGVEPAPFTTTAPSRKPEQESNIVIRTNRIWATEAAEAIEQTRRASSRKNATRGIVAAAALGVLTIVVLVTGAGGNSPAGPTQDLAVSLRDVNVRAAPSTDAKVLSTLPRGMKVAMIGQRGSWNLIALQGAGSDAQPQQGWVHSSFLKKETATAR
jgi:hypothetical protein